MIETKQWLTDTWLELLSTIYKPDGENGIVSQIYPNPNPNLNPNHNPNPNPNPNPKPNSNPNPILNPNVMLTSTLILILTLLCKHYP